MTYIDLTVHVREDTPVRYAEARVPRVVIGTGGQGIELAVWDLASCDRLLSALREARERFAGADHSECQNPRCEFCHDFRPLAGPDAAGSLPAPAAVAPDEGDTSSAADSRVRVVA